MKMPLIIAHRGASANAPENTLAAFNLALEQSADGIELDVMLSQDKELVVIHDDTVDRTTSGTGQVRQLALAELRKLDAGMKFDPAFSSEKIPLLSEVYEQFRRKFLINVELKNYSTPFDDLTERVIALTQKFGMKDQIILSSFNPLNLVKARKTDRTIQRGLLTFPKWMGSLMRSPIGRLFPYDALHPYYADLKPSLLHQLHLLNKKVNVWTIDEPEALCHLSEMGVDGIICNDPQKARQILEK